MLLAFWEDVSEQPKGMFAQVKRPEVVSLVFSHVEVVQEGAFNQEWIVCSSASDTGW